MWGESGGGADMHHIRPVEVRLNSTRSNNEYGEISNRESYKVYAKLGSQSTYALGGYNSGGTFEPLDSKKGDVARIILYVYIHYNSYDITDLFGSYGKTNGSGNSSYFSTSLLSLTKITNQNTEAKALEMLLDWNESDPVDEIEQRRNEQVATYQGNRNPFIDNSEYADMIWGDGTPSTDPRVNSVSISPTSLNLDVNGTNTGNLTATVDVSNGAPQTVTWTSSNTNVATVSTNGVVTAVAKGSCKITATSAYNSNKSASCDVKVTDSSGGGSGGSTVNVTASTTIANYASANSWANGTKYTSIILDTVATASVGTGSGNTGKYYTSGNEWRFYQTESASLTISVSDGYELVSATMSYKVSNGGILKDSNNNAIDSGSEISLSGTSVTLTVGNSGTATNGQVKFTSISVTYSYNSGGSSSSPLSSISLNTANVQTEFYVGDTFDYSGLVVTAYYENGTEDIVEPNNVSTPDMSAAGEKTITVTYSENNVEKEATYKITVLEAEITEIFASVGTIFHPGDIILTCDIHVEDNLGNEIDDGFDFAYEEYQFTYEDASSGGEITEKVFEDSVSWGGLTCSVTVQVQRIAYAAPSSTTTWTKVTDDYDLAVDDEIVIAAAESNYALSTTQNNNNRGQALITKNGNDITLTDGVQILTLTSTSGISDAPSGSFGFYTGSGYLYAASSSSNNLKTQKTNNVNGAWTIEIASNGAASIVARGSSYTRNILRYNSSSSIFSCYGSGQGAVEIYKKYSSGAQTPENVANYIMYEDTNNQCTSKFNAAKEYFEALSVSDKNTFMTSDEYVIATARERLEAWANHLGKTIVHVNGDYEISNLRIVNPIINFSNNSNNTSLIIIITSLLSISAITGYYFLRRKKEN